MKSKLILLSAFLLLSCTNLLLAQGDLSVVPRRVIFENSNKRSETLYLTNRGKDTATYNISYLNYEIDDLGNFKKVSEDSVENPASKNFRVFPRRVTLSPNETQTVKLQLRGFSNLQEGEYRSHLLFRAVPRSRVRTTVDEQENPDAVGIQVIPIYGITIPNIIRKGENDTSVEITNTTFLRNEDNSYTLDFDLDRIGKMSVYGSLSIDYLIGDGSVVNLGAIPGIAVYATNDKRKVNVKIKREDLDLTTGKIKITLISKEEASINDIVAEEVLILK